MMTYFRLLLTRVFLCFSIVAGYAPFSYAMNSVNECIDLDGDGWGWDGTASCKVGTTVTNPVNTTTTTSVTCDDPDGDGWGWDGTASCKVGTTVTNPVNTTTITTTTTTSVTCDDPDGDGWGWDGQKSCQVTDTPNDSDADGLEDTVEIFQIGTDPNNADSDHDGLNDGDEWSVHFTNPLDPDTDADGTGDFEEIAAGTDPNNAPPVVVTPVLEITEERCDDLSSSNDTWADNCLITRFGAYTYSSYVQGIQRILWCQNNNSEQSSGINTFSDGMFGPNTEASIRAYQNANQIMADGIVGPLTWASLRSKLRTISTTRTGNGFDSYYIDGCGTSTPQFYQQVQNTTLGFGESTTDLLGWKLAEFPGSSRLVDFSGDQPGTGSNPIELLSGSCREDLPRGRDLSVDYQQFNLCGWTVFMNTDLYRSDIAVDVYKDLGDDLNEVNRVLPSTAVEMLLGVNIWLELSVPEFPGGVYHPSAQWLANNGYPAKWAGGIQLGNAQNYLTWTQQQPAIVIHELAHALHHQYFNNAFPDLTAAYNSAMQAGIYDSVEYVGGQFLPAYAKNNEREYFAELTEAYFWTNDYYPFDRDDLREHDPAGYRAIELMWGIE